MTAELTTAGLMYELGQFAYSEDRNVARAADAALRQQTEAELVERACACSDLDAMLLQSAAADEWRAAKARTYSA